MQNFYEENLPLNSKSAPTTWENTRSTSKNAENNKTYETESNSALEKFLDKYYFFRFEFLPQSFFLCSPQLLCSTLQLRARPNLAFFPSFSNLSFAKRLLLFHFRHRHLPLQWLRVRPSDLQLT